MVGERKSEEGVRAICYNSEEDSPGPYSYARPTTTTIHVHVPRAVSPNRNLWPPRCALYDGVRPFGNGDAGVMDTDRHLAPSSTALHRNVHVVRYVPCIVTKQSVARR